LLTREELAQAVDEDKYFKVQVDNRDLNYESFTQEGNTDRNNFDTEYNSHITKRLNINEIKSKLLETTFIKDVLEGNTSEGE
jgi:UDP-glucose 4-epimerase